MGQATLVNCWVAVEFGQSQLHESAQSLELSVDSSDSNPGALYAT
jgi:hypothetical protein